MTHPPDPNPALTRSVLSAYRQGWFPMGNPHSGEVEWVQPARRAVIPLDPPPAFARSLRAKARRTPFRFTTDTAFEAVIRACAAPSPLPGRDSTWIDPAILDTFLHLHRAGHAHSIEVWGPATSDAGSPLPPTPTADATPTATAPLILIGGLYGLAIGRAFMGESMFCRPDVGGTDASKLALFHLVHHLRRRGFMLLDSQIQNPHMKSLGAIEIPRAVYLQRLKAATTPPSRIHPQRAADPQRAEWLPFDPLAAILELNPPTT